MFGILQKLTLILKHIMVMSIMEKVVIRRILISEELNNQERFNAATKSLVSTTKEEMGGKFKIVFGVFAAVGQG